MNRKKLNKLRRTIEGLRRQSPKALEIQKVARQLGRKKVKRGKEPVWESLEFQNLRPLSIPDHGGRDLTPGVSRSILNQPGRRSHLLGRADSASRADRQGG